MHRNDRPGNVAGMFSMGNPGSGQPATQLGADWPNAMQEEVIAVIEEAEIELDKEDNTQLLQAIQTLIASAVGNLSGTIIAFGGTEAPTGYLECDGSAVSRTTYSVLFAAIGTTWGVGNGTTTFNLPNLARRTLVGAGGSGTGVLGNVVGNTGGTETHTLTTAEMPAHTHPPTDGEFGLFGGGAPTFAMGAGGAWGSATATGSSGDGGAHNNMQPSAVVMYCIKT